MNNDLKIKEMNIEKIEKYSDLIEDIKLALTIEAGALDDDIKALLKEAKHEIIGLQDYIQNMELENERMFFDNCLMARQLYVNEKLLDVKSKSKRTEIKRLLLTTDADMKHMDIKQIDNIFNVVIGEK